MLDQLGYDITDFWQLCLNTNMLNRFCGQRAMRCSWSSSERKIDRCLALFHHDRESTLPTQTLRSDRVAVLRQSWRCWEAPKVVPKYQPGIAAMGWRRLDWPVQILPLGLNSNIWLMGIKFHSFFSISLCSRLCCKTIWGRTIRFNYRFLCSNSENLSAYSQSEPLTSPFDSITCLYEACSSLQILSTFAEVLNDLNPMPAFISRFTARDDAQWCYSSTSSP